jgi:hypothetical protein
MANHLRDLIECIDRNDIFISLGQPKDRTQEAVDWVVEQSANAVCFDVGEVKDFAGMAIIHDLCRLPDPTCWIEMHRDLDDGRDTVGVMAYESDKKTSATVWHKGPEGWSFFFTFWNDLENMETRVADFANGEKEMVKFVVDVYKAFLSALNCTNIKRVEHKPDTKLQKARATRGKAPLFSYWTLQLDGKSERAEDQGGTHASPRVHLRRGHPRQYVPGKWTWVQAHAVGNKAAGMVHKDYSAGPALMAAAR